MAQESNSSRRQLEGLIVLGLRELKGLETGLNRQFAGLRRAPVRDRRAFLGSLVELEQRARRLEQLIDALEQGSPVSGRTESHKTVN